MSTDREWLRALYAALFEQKEETHYFGLRAERRVVDHPRRALTPEEWDRVAAIVKRDELPCELATTHFGFAIGLVIYDHTDLPETRPPLLCWVDQDQLPGNAPDNHVTTPAARWERAWQEFTALSHTPRNAELAAFYRLEAPRERAHYEY